MTEVVVERKVAAPAEEVYAYLTDSGLWQRWQGDGATLDARVGGRFRMQVRDGPTAAGEFVALEPGRRVVLTWGWEGHPAVPPGSTRVEIELLPAGEGTLVRLTHSGLPATEVADHEWGWRHYLPRLAEVAEGGEPGADPGPGPRP